MNIKLAFQLVQNMGLRYVMFRVLYVVKSKLGWQKRVFPMQPPFKKFINLNDWKKELPPFFFYGKNIKGLEKNESPKLKQEFEAIKNGIFTFFSKSKFDLGTDYNWITNPSTGYQYNINTHWSAIKDLSTEAGDIKFVWEKARFSFLYDLIRYDYHFNKDQSVLVFKEIEDFIDKNPINQGPNYVCSQEISLRILNWTFALYYYKDAAVLTAQLFEKIINTIYWQLQHVYKNINFSRIAVRNNHAITETLMLYLSNKLFPFIPETKKWSVKGKQWFEQEIAYQIYEDGTFLQFSMNYHRVAVQLLTWGIQLAKLNGESFKPVVYERAKKSLAFLDACTDPITGKLPNYGANDGALFFKLTTNEYRNYKAQLDDLRLVLYQHTYFKTESSYWYGFKNPIIVPYVYPKQLNEFKNGGYYIAQDGDTKTFIKCGAYKDRPSHADNLHIDIWVNGINFLRDAGTYKYNTNKDLLHYFNGGEGHNTVSVDNADQMLKGGRFIWYYWVKKASATLINKENKIEFKGTITAFKHLGKNMKHSRNVVKNENENNWQINDVVNNKGAKLMKQYWHINPAQLNHISIVSTDQEGKQLQPIIEEKWYSGYYGIKEKSVRYTFETKGSQFNTSIKIKL